MFRDGAKSTDFWILLAKAVAVIHMLLSIVFVNSTIKVKEEPPLKGMNVQIKKFKDWLDKNNNSLPPGRRASDYWFVAGSILFWMLFAVQGRQCRLRIIWGVYGLVLILLKKLCVVS